MDKTEEVTARVDLGSASVETKGPVGFEKDEALGIPAMGLADD